MLSRNRYLDSAKAYLHEPNKFSYYITKYAETGKSDTIQAYYNYMIGIYNSNLGKYRHSIQKINEAINLFSKAGLTLDLAQAHLKIGSVFFKMNNYTESENHYFQALAIYESLSDISGIKSSLYMIIDNYKHWGKYDKAIEYSDLLAIINKFVNSSHWEEEYGKLRNKTEKEIQHKVYLQQKRLIDSLEKEREIEQLRSVQKEQEIQNLLRDKELAKLESDKKEKELETLKQLKEIERLEDERKAQEIVNLKRMQEIEGMKLDNLEETNRRQKEISLLFITFSLLLFAIISGAILLRFRMNRRYTKKLEENNKELERTNIQLEKSKRDILYAKELAERANQFKSEFLANMSHEIRTPMNAILGFSELIKTGITDPKHKKYIQSIIANGKNLLVLINDVLDLSKIESGKLNLEYQSIDIRNLINEVYQIFSFKFEEKNLTFYREVAENIPHTIIIDEARMRQILVNLVGNALKFTDEGQVAIEVHGEVFPDGTFDMQINVIDTGIGIPKDQQELIFESFTQKSGQSTRNYGGTGLGLAISKKLCDLMGGSINVESEVNAGSKFIVKIPEIKISDLPPENKMLLESDAVDNIKFQNAKLLVVDDIPHNRQIILDYLADQPIEIYQAANGLEALEIIDKVEFDLILLDLRMPELDGYSVIEKLKENQSLCHIPVVALTASVMKNEMAKISSFQFNDYLQKPTIKNDLFKLMKKYLKFEDFSEVISQPTSITFKQNINEMIARKEEIIFSLNNGFIPKALELSSKLKMREIKEFEKSLESFARKYHIEGLFVYLKVLNSSMESFNKKSISESLTAFNQIAEDIINMLNNE